MIKLRVGQISMRKKLKLYLTAYCSIGFLGHMNTTTLSSQPQSTILYEASISHQLTRSNDIFVERNFEQRRLLRRF